MLELRNTQDYLFYKHSQFSTIFSHICIRLLTRYYCWILIDLIVLKQPFTQGQISNKLTQSFQCSVFRNNQSSLSCKCIVLKASFYTYLSCAATEIIYPFFIKWVQKVFDPVSYLLFITIFEFTITFWV